MTSYHNAYQISSVRHVKPYTVKVSDFHRPPEMLINLSIACSVVMVMAVSALLSIALRNNSGLVSSIWALCLVSTIALILWGKRLRGKHVKKSERFKDATAYKYTQVLQDSFLDYVVDERFFEIIGYEHLRAIDDRRCLSDLTHIEFFSSHEEEGPHIYETMSLTFKGRKEAYNIMYRTEDRRYPTRRSEGHVVTKESYERVKGLLFENAINKEGSLFEATDNGHRISSTQVLKRMREDFMEGVAPLKILEYVLKVSHDDVILDYFISKSQIKELSKDLAKRLIRKGEGDSGLLKIALKEEKSKLHTTILKVVERMEAKSDRFYYNRTVNGIDNFTLLWDSQVNIDVDSGEIVVNIFQDESLRFTPNTSKDGYMHRNGSFDLLGRSTDDLDTIRKYSNIIY